jgi:hypothetical protein
LRRSGSEIVSAIIKFAVLDAPLLEIMFGDSFTLSSIGISPEIIASNSIPFFSVDFFSDVESTSAGTSLAVLLRNIVQGFFQVVLTISIMSMIVVLLWLIIKKIFFMLRGGGMSPGKAAKIEGSIFDWAEGLAISIFIIFFMISAEKISDALGQAFLSTTYNTGTYNSEEELKAAEEEVLNNDDISANNYMVTIYGDNLYKKLVQSGVDTAESEEEAQTLILGGSGVVAVEGDSVQNFINSITGKITGNKDLSAANKVIISPTSYMEYARLKAQILYESVETADNSDDENENSEAVTTSVEDYDVAETMNWLGWSIAYILQGILTIAFVVLYTKRVMVMAGLTIIAPAVGLMYPIDKSSGAVKSHTLNKWGRAYIGNLIIQPIHCIEILLFITTASSILMDNPWYLIICYYVMLRFDKVLHDWVDLPRGVGDINSTLKDTTRTLEKFGRIGTSAIKNSIKGNLRNASKVFGAINEYGTEYLNEQEQGQIREANNSAGLSLGEPDNGNIMGIGGRTSGTGDGASRLVEGRVGENPLGLGNGNNRTDPLELPPNSDTEETDNTTTAPQNSGEMDADKIRFDKNGSPIVPLPDDDSLYYSAEGTQFADIENDGLLGDENSILMENGNFESAELDNVNAESLNGENEVEMDTETSVVSGDVNALIDNKNSEVQGSDPAEIDNGNSYRVQTNAQNQMEQFEQMEKLSEDSENLNSEEYGERLNPSEVDGVLGAENVDGYSQDEIESVVFDPIAIEAIANYKALKQVPVNANVGEDVQNSEKLEEGGTTTTSSMRTKDTISNDTVKKNSKKKSGTGTMRLESNVPGTGKSKSEDSTYVNVHPQLLRSVSRQGTASLSGTNNVTNTISSTQKQSKSKESRSVNNTSEPISLNSNVSGVSGSSSTLNIGSGSSTTHRSYTTRSTTSGGRIEGGNTATGSGTRQQGSNQTGNASSSQNRRNNNESYRAEQNSTSSNRTNAQQTSQGNAQQYTFKEQLNNEIDAKKREVAAKVGKAKDYAKRVNEMFQADNMQSKQAKREELLNDIKRDSNDMARKRIPKEIEKAGRNAQRLEDAAKDGGAVDKAFDAVGKVGKAVVDAVLIDDAKTTAKKAENAFWTGVEKATGVTGLTTDGTTTKSAGNLASNDSRAIETVYEYTENIPRRDIQTYLNQAKSDLNVKEYKRLFDQVGKDNKKTEILATLAFNARKKKMSTDDFKEVLKASTLGLTDKQIDAACEFKDKIK